MLPTEIVAVLPGDTAATWKVVAPLVHPNACLAGGTAVACHLHHRLSRDLGVFFDGPLDTASLRATLEQRGTFAVERQSHGTLNGVFNATRVQFLAAQGQRLGEATSSIGGLRVAGLGDLQGMKLRAITDRAEHRDYFDIYAIEAEGGRTVEEGIAFLLHRWDVRDDSVVVAVVQALGAIDECEVDPALGATVADLRPWFAARQREVALNLDRYGSLPVRRAPSADPTSGVAGSTAGRCAAVTTRGVHCTFGAQGGSTQCRLHQARRRR